jgi:RNA polymerase-binding transcription factor DksA
MSRIEAEARTLLLQRRESLCRHPEERDDLTASWRDWETAPEPRAESTRQELAEIEDALRRIEEGIYGTCEACGGPMGMQRIRAIPEARYCLTCSGIRNVE